MLRLLSLSGALIAILLCVVLTSGCRARVEEAEEESEEASEEELGHGRLNVVLIMVDSLRADALGAYREGLGTSRYIDLLASEGVLFEQCSTSSPSSLPSHATIMTGKYPYAHGVRADSGYRLTHFVRARSIR